MNVIICDDNEHHIAECRERLMRLSRKHGIPVEVSTFQSGKQMVFEVDPNDGPQRVDVIYLDNNMPDCGGMEVAASLRDAGYRADIVFYTVDQRPVLQAFDVDALHYWVKGISSEDQFERIFLKAASRAEKRNREVLLLSCAGEHRQIPVSEISYFETRQRVIIVHYNGDSFEFYSTLAKIEEALYGKGFVRLHKSYVVAKQMIVQLNANSVVLRDGSIIPVGRTYEKNLKNIQMYMENCKIHNL